MTSLLDIQPPTPADDTTFTELLEKINERDKAAIVERFITQGLPNADHEQLARLRSTLDEAIPYQNFFDVLLKGLETAEKFCGRKLRDALLKKHDARFRIHDTIRLKPQASTDKAGNTYSLLHAAMLNFTDQEAAPGFFSADSEVLPDLQDAPSEAASEVKLGAQPFATFCRQLDLGGAYQKNITQTFQVSSVQLHAVQLSKLNMRLAAYEKHLTQRIDAALLTTLINLTRLNDDINHNALFNNAAIQLKSVTLFGKYETDAFLIVCRPTSSATEDTYILYIPDDPELGFYPFDSEENCRIALATKLLVEPALRALIASGLYKAEQAEFMTNNPGHMSFVSDIAFNPLKQGFFKQIFSRRVDKLCADSKEVAVPVGNVNEPVYAKRRENRALRKRPALSSTLIYDFSRRIRTTAADALLSHVFTGVEDWTCVEKYTALSQLLTLKQHLLPTAANSDSPDPSAETAGDYFKQFEVREQADSQLGYRLWKRDLAAYPPRPHIADRVMTRANANDDDSRVLSFNGRHYVRIDDSVYEVEPNPLAWRLRHPLNPDAYRPPVVYSPDSGWRLQTK
jgi:hypothetical protein